MLYTISILGVLAACGWILWRISSTRHTLPCPAWLAWMIELDNPFARAHKAWEIIETLPLKKGMKCLDIGCGPGRVSLPLAQKIAEMGGSVTGLDIQAEMLAKTSKRAKELNIQNIDFVQGDIHQIPIEQVYDVALMICVLGEIPKDVHEAVLKKIVSHLQPGGLISITETIFDPHFQRHQTVRKLMEKIACTETMFTGNWLAYTAHFKKNDL